MSLEFLKSWSWKVWKRSCILSQLLCMNPGITHRDWRIFIVLHALNVYIHWTPVYRLIWRTWESPAPSNSGISYEHENPCSWRDSIPEPLTLETDALPLRHWLSQSLTFLLRVCFRRSWMLTRLSVWRSTSTSVACATRRCCRTDARGTHTVWRTSTASKCLKTWSPAWLTVSTQSNFKGRFFLAKFL
jgi:hypothetical protein